MELLPICFPLSKKGACQEFKKGLSATEAKHGFYCEGLVIHKSRAAGHLSLFCHFAGGMLPRSEICCQKYTAFSLGNSRLLRGEAVHGEREACRGLLICSSSFPRAFLGIWDKTYQPAVKEAVIRRREKGEVDYLTGKGTYEGRRRRGSSWHTEDLIRSQS